VEHGHRCFLCPGDRLSHALLPHPALRADHPRRDLGLRLLSPGCHGAGLENLRLESLRRGLVHPKAKDLLAFHQAFLETIRRGGRLHEVGLIAAYKLKTLHLLQDVLLAPKLMARGKLNPLPHGIAGKEAVRRIFERCGTGSLPVDSGATGVTETHPGDAEGGGT
jgi:hypothetical protein